MSGEKQKIAQESDCLSVKVVSATKWSLITQVVSKIISPITTFILAHILAPEVFGVVALVAMVTSFADMFSDAGFQKYLIQHEYESDKHYLLSCSVAFWTNLTISLLLWSGIALVRDSLAAILGNPSIGLALVVACASLPLTAAVSVQTAVYQRKFDFKTLFYSRIGSSLLILFVSVPLAIFGFGYWSIIVSTIVSNLFLAIWLTIKSSWKPCLCFSIRELKKMFSFSAWTLVEAFSIWLTSWVGSFILGVLMNTYYLGLYNTSAAFVNAVVGIITSAINPIVFATLSRLQADECSFSRSFYRMQKYLAFAVIPLATALAIFSDVAIGLCLGENWLEASTYFGLYSIASAFVVVFCHTASDAYRAKGKPKYSLLAQVAFLCVMVPSYVIGALFGWRWFSVVVPVTRMVGFVVIHFVICKTMMKLSPWKMIINLKWIYFVSVLVAVPSFIVIHVFALGYFAQCIVIIFAMFLYFVLCLTIKDLRETLIVLLECFGLKMISSKLSI